MSSALPAAKIATQLRSDIMYALTRIGMCASRSVPYVRITNELILFISKLYGS